MAKPYGPRMKTGKFYKRKPARKTKRKSRKVAKKQTPVLAQLRYQFVSDSSAGTADIRFLDVAAGLSLQNRRLYE